MPNPPEVPTPRGNVVILQAGPTDAAALREIRIQALAQHPRAFAADLEAARAETQQSWSERLAGTGGHPPMAIFKAQVGETLVGMAGIIPGHWPKTAHSATIWGVFVAREHRRQGIARALIEACIAWARTKGVILVRLAVNTTNVAAVRCYMGAGFSPYGVAPKAICWQGAYLDELLLSRALNPEPKSE